MSYKLKLLVSIPPPPQVNDVLVNLPFIFASGQIYAYYSGSCVIIQTDFGLSVSYGWASYVSVSIPESYSGSLCGLGGDFNGDGEDDFKSPNGSVVQDAVSFGDSWKDPRSPFHCMATGPSDTCSDTERAQYRSQRYCGVISDMNGPFKDCRSSTDAQVHLENCVRDMCATHGSWNALCELLTGYAQQCQADGVNILPWREIARCERACPPNSHYVLCGSSCPASCAQPDGPPNCRPACLEGCQCEPGFVLSGSDCVPQEQCGCSHSGCYYVPGETFFWEGERCQKMYRCNGSTHVVDSSASSCSSGEHCGVEKGVYGCHTRSDAICRASGFLHYTTFDGRHYDFPGTSGYVFVELCGMSQSLPSFRVEVKNEKLPNSALSVTSEVLVWVDNTQIHLQRGHRGTVKRLQGCWDAGAAFCTTSQCHGRPVATTPPDGAFQLTHICLGHRTPMSPFSMVCMIGGVIKKLPLKSQGLVIYWHGFRTVLQTDLGLTVSYDTTHSLLVTLSPKYRGQTCGLCGNFNGVADDDFMMRNRSVVKDALDFGTNWQSETFPAAIDGLNSSYPKLPEGKLLLESKSMCWIIQNPDGPFAPCHSQIDPEPYMTDCVFDLYSSVGDFGVLCQSIEAYVSACQSANITLWPWRKEFFCAADCPAKSHYELCHLPCRDHCMGSTLKNLCQPVCAEGCVCDDGYVWDGDQCVQPGQCGCEYNGQYYTVGDLLWLSDCTQRCQCDAPSTFRCLPASCHPGQRCAVKDGKLGCWNPLATCSVSGDPHYFTFDGAVAHFQGTCAYEISKTDPSFSDLSFRIVAANKNFRNRQVSFLYRVEMWLSFEHFSFHVVLEQGKDVLVDGTSTPLPARLKEVANITQTRDIVTVTVRPNLEIEYNGRHALFVRVGPEYQGKLHGMCGNFNNNKKDDKVLPDGKSAKNDSEFGNAWISDTSSPGCSNDLGQSEPCSELPQFEQMCEILRNRSGPFSECHWHESPDLYYESCVYDLCYYGLTNRMLCAAIEAYDEMCTAAGVKLPDWRQALECDVACPANSYYDFCGSACATTCANLSSSSECTEPCVAGCFCQEGYVLNNGTCVLRDQCGCVMDEHFYQPGDEVILTGTCSKKCSCVWPGQSMECRDFSCGVLEMCKIVNGVRGCHPVQYSTMLASGSLRYITLDGRMFDYQGVCRYPLTTYCGPPGELPAFTVYATNRRERSTGAPSIRLMELNVYGEHIIVTGQKNKIQVNGILVNLPILLASGKVLAYFSGCSVILQTDFGLSVSYDPSYYVSISVPETYSGLLCGLGGNFNWNRKDDFRTPDGTVVQDAVAFGDSWKDVTCLSQGTTTRLLSPCSETELARYRSQSYCGVIGDTHGPFRECHNPMNPQVHMENCVKDLCATQGNRKMLCKALQSYTWQCQVRGVIIQPWREMTGCGISRYIFVELCGMSQSLPFFRVEVKNEKLPKSPFAITSEVFVMLNNTQVHLQRGHRGTVKVGGVAVHLPANIEALGTAIYTHGFYTILQTDFGLTVSYDMTHSLFVTLPPKYRSQTCGLCGNFNGVADDDFLMWNMVKGTSRFAMNWKMETGPGSVNHSSDSYPELAEGELLIRSKSMCRIIQDPAGPFALCHSWVDPEPYLTNCVFDLYVSAGEADVLCQSVQAYTAACQRANISISSWRRNISCTTDCQANSHYKLSGTPCQDFCSPALNCLRTGSEGCFCNKGYQLSGNSCIPKEECGCVHNGLPYRIGEHVWLDSCHKRCRCDSPSKFHCIPDSCSPGQTCAVKDGKLGCQNQLTTCTVAGDSHYFTFDGTAAQFQGPCAFELLRTCDTSSHFFRVVAKNSSHGNLHVSFVTQVEVWLQSGALGSHIVLGNGSIVKVNQEAVQLPHSLGSLGNISKMENLLMIKAAANVEIQYSDPHALFIHVGPEHQGKLCGMCGNFSGLHEDDKVLPNRNRAHNDSQFGHAEKTETSPGDQKGNIQH
uniref:Uncharacterized protein n=1 Tax=Sphaerodactylus townsendi TaxID=933632 RepID=A0ACB8FS17_9SAUR